MFIEIKCKGVTRKSFINKVFKNLLLNFPVLQEDN